MSSNSTLRFLKWLEAEFGQDGLQKLRRGQLRLRHHRIDDVVFELRQKGLQQRRLAGTDLARNDHEAVSKPDRRLHVRLGPRVLLAPVHELGVGGQPERLFLELEVIDVGHSCCSDDTGASLPAFPARPLCPVPPLKSALRHSFQQFADQSRRARPANRPKR